MPPLSPPASAPSPPPVTAHNLLTPPPNPHCRRSPMRKSGLLNPALTSAVARLGHRYLRYRRLRPAHPHDVPVIDLTLTFGIPTFADTLSALRGGRGRSRHHRRCHPPEVRSCFPQYRLPRSPTMTSSARSPAPPSSCAPVPPRRLPMSSCAPACLSSAYKRFRVPYGKHFHQHFLLLNGVQHAVISHPYSSATPAGQSDRSWWIWVLGQSTDRALSPLILLSVSLMDFCNSRLACRVNAML